MPVDLIAHAPPFETPPGISGAAPPRRGHRANDDARALAGDSGIKGQTRTDERDCASPGLRAQSCDVPCLADRRPVTIIDLDAARRFFRVMAPDESLTFQTLDDSRAKRPGRTAILHGTIDAVAERLCSLNASGAGIYWMVNRGDGAGRKASNVRAVRALFLDLDSAPLEPVLARGVPPHAVIESSPGKWHVYWLVAGCELAQFTPMQRALAANFAGDAKVIDLPRVLRVPGFLHCKGAPVVSRLHLLKEQPPYPVSELAQRLGRVAAAKVRAGGEMRGGAAADVRGTATEDAQKTPEVSLCSLLSSSVGPVEVPPSCVPSMGGQRNDALFRFARYLRGVIPSATREQRRAALEQWHEKARPHIRSEDFAVSWADFERGWESVNTPHGAIMSTIIPEAKDSPLVNGIETLCYGEAGNLLVRICAALHTHQQANHGGEPLFLSARQAGALLNVHFTDAATMLRAMVADGVLELVRQGRGNMASRYRYVWGLPSQSAATAPRDANSAASGGREIRPSGRRSPNLTRSRIDK